MSPKDAAASAAAGAILCVGMMAALRPVYLEEQAEREALYREWAAQQREADRVYAAEVAAENLRWDKLETARTVDMREREPEPDGGTDPDIPDDIEDAAERWGAVYGISPEFLEAVAWRESSFDPSAENEGCIGLMQVSPYWHRDRMERLGVTEDGLWTVEGSMAVAADYLRELFGQNNDPVWVLMKYNGDSDAGSYLADGESPSEYAADILEMTAELEGRHE